MTDQCGACNQCLHDRQEEEGLQYLHCRAEQWDWEITISDPGLVAFLPSKSGLWRSSSKLPGYQLRQLRGWRAPSEDPAVLTQMAKVECSEPVRPLGGGRAYLPYGRCKTCMRFCNSLYEGPTRWWRWRSLVTSLSVRSCWVEQTVNCLLKACAIAFELECVFSLKGDWDVWWGTRPLAAWLVQKSSAWEWWRGRRTPRGWSTGLALLGEWAAGCPGPSAW